MSQAALGVWLAGVPGTALGDFGKNKLAPKCLDCGYEPSETDLRTGTTPLGRQIEKAQRGLGEAAEAQKEELFRQLQSRISRVKSKGLSSTDKRELRQLAHTVGERISEHRIRGHHVAAAQYQGLGDDITQLRLDLFFRQSVTSPGCSFAVALVFVLFGVIGLSEATGDDIPAAIIGICIGIFFLGNACVRTIQRWARQEARDNSSMVNHKGITRNSRSNGRIPLQATSPPPQRVYERTEHYAVGSIGAAVCIWLAYETGGEWRKGKDETGSIPMLHTDHERLGNSTIAEGKKRTDKRKRPIMATTRREHKSDLIELYKARTTSGKQRRLGLDPWPERPDVASLQIVAVVRTEACVEEVVRTVRAACRELFGLQV